MINRRDLLLTSAAVAAGVPGNAQSGSGAGKRVVISSANGRAACKQAREMLDHGADTLDAVIAGVNIIELDPTTPLWAMAACPMKTECRNSMRV